MRYMGRRFGVLFCGRQNKGWFAVKKSVVFFEITGDFHVHSIFKMFDRSRNKSLSAISEYIIYIYIIYIVMFFRTEHSLNKKIID